jgi:predicted nicotinamide N-methyase
VIEAEAFIRANTVPSHAPLVPEILLALATEITPIWQATETLLARHNIEPPFWAFAWPGAQALARTILDNPAHVENRRVLDFAAGCGLAAIACVLAGAADIEACELDPLAIAAIAHNARTNAVTLTATCADLVGQPSRWDLILCGDVCYEAPMTGHILPWLQSLADQGTTVWIADPGRAYLPTASLDPLGIAYDVPTSRELEDRTTRHTVLYRLRPGALPLDPAGDKRPQTRTT